MPAILTLTMNPALDISTSVEKVQPAHKLRCEAAVVHPGGGGINVARVLARLGCDVLAIFPTGGVTGEAVSQLLCDEQVPLHTVPIQAQTRQSFSTLERCSGQEFRFVLPGPALSPSECVACLHALDTRLRAPTDRPRFLVISGSLPPGAPTDFYAQAARLCKSQGISVALDTSGEALEATLAEGVDIIKPSLRELQELTGRPLGSPDEWLQAARQLIAQGRTQVVALSLGDQGAMLITAQGAWRSDALKVPVQSTIGAGDSFFAGLVWGLSQGQDTPQAFRQAMAAGAAALLQQGTALASRADMDRLLTQVQIVDMTPN